MNVDVLWKLLFVLCISGFLTSSGEAGKVTKSYSSDYHDEEPNPSKLKKDRLVRNIFLKGITDNPTDNMFGLPVKRYSIGNGWLVQQTID